jgi:hypothetical protein
MGMKLKQTVELRDSPTDNALPLAYPTKLCKLAEFERGILIMRQPLNHKLFID